MDKVVVANGRAMGAKYGMDGLARVRAALDRLVEADLGRGLVTEVAWLDDPVTMAACGGPTVADASDDEAAKRAVDAVCDDRRPDYLLLLDGPDVVPHVRLDRIGGVLDVDDAVPSDLPYACAVPFGRRADAFLAVTRVVGRLPMTRGDRDAGRFASLIDRCATHVPGPVDDYRRPFVICADPWRQSTLLSLTAAFGGDGPPLVSPMAGHGGIDADLGRLAHFVNCHGRARDPCFYGYAGRTYPIAMRSDLVGPNVAPGTVAAVECCYGGELYDVSNGDVAPPMCTAYLLGGASAFLGSTTVTYGSSTSNGQADLLTQYFMAEVLRGASTGRALLQARQRFVSGQPMSTPMNLKTLAQFVLYGDPSLTVVEPPEAARVDASDGGRKLRRAHLNASGLAAAAAATRTGGRIRPSDALAGRVRALSRERGYASDPVFLSVTGGPLYRRSARTLPGRHVLAVVSAQERGHGGWGDLADPHTCRTLVVHVVGDEVSRIDECQSR